MVYVTIIGKLLPCFHTRAVGIFFKHEVEASQASTGSGFDFYGVNIPFKNNPIIDLGTAAPGLTGPIEKI